MSMLSAQIEKLRKAAQTYRTLGNHKLEQLLLDAADTISELRDMAQQAQRENAKLRELVRFIMHQCNDGNQRCDECISWNDGECVALQRMRELGVEVE